MREENSVVAEPQPELAGVLTLEGFDVAHSGDRVMKKAVKDTHSSGPFESANIGARFLGPLDAKRHSL